MNVFRFQPKPLVRVHLNTGETVEGFLTGRYSGHYHISKPTIILAADTRVAMDSPEVALPYTNTKLVELLHT